MSSVIEDINGKSKEALSSELTSRNITPALTLEEMRSQARIFNKEFKLKKVLQKIDEETQSDSESDSGSKKIKYTKVIYNEAKSFTSSLSNWDIMYDGHTCVREFIAQVEEKCRTRNLKYSDLVRCFPDILCGVALLWFRNIYHSDLTWNELSNLLIKQFENNNRQIELKKNLFNMTQKDGVSVFEFSLKMQQINNMLESKLSDTELLQLCMKALLPSYNNLLACRDFNTFTELTEATNKLESLNISNSTGSRSNFNKPRINSNYHNYSNNFRYDNNKHSFQHNSYRNNNNNSKNNYNKYYNETTTGNQFNNNNTRLFYNQRSKPNVANDYKNKETSHNYQGSNNNNIYCSFCNIRGHLLSDCRKKASCNPNPRVGSLKHKDPKN